MHFTCDEFTYSLRNVREFTEGKLQKDSGYFEFIKEYNACMFVPLFRIKQKGSKKLHLYQHSKKYDSNGRMTKMLYGV